jgi:hypothetical protein
MAALTMAQAQKQLSDEVKWWRAQYPLERDKNGQWIQIDWQNRQGWTSFRGNASGGAASIREEDYNRLGNAWCGTTGNKEKKRSERIDKKTDIKIFKEADQSLSGGTNTCHFMESWGNDKFIWHFRIERAKKKQTVGA